MFLFILHLFSKPVDSFGLAVSVHEDLTRQLWNIVQIKMIQPSVFVGNQKLIHKKIFAKVRKVCASNGKLPFTSQICLHCSDETYCSSSELFPRVGSSSIASSVVNFPACYGDSRSPIKLKDVDLCFFFTFAAFVRYGRAKNRGSMGLEISKLPSASS